MAFTSCFVILIIISCSFTFTLANRTAVEQLYQTLLTNYNPYIRPNSNQNQQTVAVATMHLISINGLDELSGTLSTVVYIDITWTDSRMVWNKTDFGNTQQILVPQKLVWKPDLIVTNPVKQVRKIGFDDIMIRYQDDGAALWYTGDYIETSCDIDITHFPFDRQLCKIEMIPWNYRHRELQLLISRNDINLENFTQNGEWVLYGTAAERVGDGPFEYIYFKLYLERRSSFFIVNLFIPVVLLTLLNCMVFLLSADSGERVGYAITCLLSMTVYLTLVSDTIPKTSKPISVLSFVLMILLILSAFICFLTIIGLRFHFRKEEKPLHPWLIKVTRALRCKRFKKCCWSVFIKCDCHHRRIESAETEPVNSKSNTRRVSLQIDNNMDRSRRYSQQADYNRPVVALVGNFDEGSKSGIYKQSVRVNEDSEVIYEDYNEVNAPEYNVETWKTFAKLFDKYCFFLCASTVIVLGALYIMISIGRLSM
ncbi:neuronal acetylcholine receptor subunit beta-2-like [Ostrea edulis]|uniref:neuronal acetylcholine receptor subunit beta-2-like n=1 Tax=Ostrea edulis TaxID=37623 RepID=UPI0024AF8E58|nr:neuronal acetylcholine receptor subunit beta-2-like [Ostrea edulis]